jgi:hypothetical protein
MIAQRERRHFPRGLRTWPLSTMPEDSPFDCALTPA